VQAITELRGLGLTLAQIRWLASRYPDQNGQLIGPLLARRVRAGRARVEAQIARLEQTRRRLDSFEAVHRDALAGRPGAESSTAVPQSCSGACLGLVATSSPARRTRLRGGPTRRRHGVMQAGKSPARPGSA
jgi:MerR-like DNA binding protein